MNAIWNNRIGAWYSQRSKLARVLLLVLLASCALALAIWLLIWLPPHLTEDAKYLLLASAAVGGLVLLVYWLIPWYQRNRFFRQQVGGLAPGNPQDEAEPRKAMAKALASAMDILQDSKQRTEECPLYRVPWFLLLGEKESKQFELLRIAGSKASPVALPKTPVSKTGQYWQWWIYKDAVAVETDPCFVCEPEDSVSRGIWYRALQLLSEQRYAMPVNGVLICLSATKLKASTEESIREQGRRLLRLLTEINRFFMVDVPIYVIVTECEGLQGFADFIGSLPDEVRDLVKTQALGYRQDYPPQVFNPQTCVQGVFENLSQRLHTIRLSLLKESKDPLAREGIFNFVEDFATLDAPLKTFFGVVFEKYKTQNYTPSFRGIYFTATDTAKSAFVEDMFPRILAPDQPLAKKTPKAQWFGWLRSIVFFAIALGFSAYLSIQVRKSHVDDQALLSLAEKTCQNPSDKLSVQEAIQCLDQITELESINEKRDLKLGMNQTGERINLLKQKFTEDFRRLALVPYDSGFEQATKGKSLTFAQFLAGTERLAWLEDCQHQRDKCDQAPDNIAGMFSPEVFFLVHKEELGDSRTAINNDQRSLSKLYGAYLKWMPVEALSAEMNAETKRLRQMFKVRMPTTDELVRWADSHYPKVELQAYWQGRPNLPKATKADVAALSAAYTRKFKDEIMDPFKNRSGHFMPENVDAVQSFYADYDQHYALAWRDFLRGFTLGSSYWSGNPTGLATLLSGDKNPYDLIWKVVADNFASDKTLSSAPWLTALKLSLYKDWSPIQELYKKDLYGLSKDQNGEKSYILLAEIFSPKGGERASSEIKEFWAIWNAVENPPQALKPEDYEAWSVMQGPRRLWLRLLVYRAGDWIQARWRDAVYDPAQKLPAMGQQQFLFGEHGKADVFAQEWLPPFLSENGQNPKEVLGDHVRFRPEFTQFLGRRDEFKPTSGKELFRAGILVFTAPSRFSGLPGAAKGTEFKFSCTGQPQTVDSRERTQGTLLWSPESCTDVTIKISLSARPETLPPPAKTGDAGTPPTAQVPAPMVEIGFTKTYASLIEFINDFKSGQKTFDLNELTCSAPDEWEKLPSIKTVTVSVKFDQSEEMRNHLQGPKPLAIPKQIVEINSDYNGMH